MPAISPYLDDLLNRWISRGNDLRKEVEFQKDVIDPSALAAHGNRLAMRERRRRDIRDLEKSFMETRARWDERLQRIEGWKNSLADLKNEEAHLQSLLRASVWLQKARHYQEDFTNRLERRAAVLVARHQSIHERLFNWITALEEHESSLQDLLQKEESRLRPFYVSRGRKQPEVDFVLAQAAISDALGADIQALRRLLNHLRDRLRKALNAIEQRASGAEIFYEIHKQEILSALRGTEHLLDRRREEVLTEALVYEGGRHLLRRLQGVVQKLRCIEDMPRSSRSSWKKLFSKPAPQTDTSPTSTVIHPES